MDRMDSNLLATNNKKYLVESFHGYMDMVDYMYIRNIFVSYKKKTHYNYD